MVDIGSSAPPPRTAGATGAQPERPAAPEASPSRAVTGASDAALPPARYDFRVKSDQVPALALEPLPKPKLMTFVAESEEPAAIFATKGPRERDALRESIYAREAAVAKGMAHYPEATQAHLKAIQQQVAGDLDAMASLQNLVLEPKFSPDCRARTLESLAALCGPDKQLAVDQMDLVCELVQEIANPTTIRQGNNDTCAATSVQIMVASQSPDEYVRLVAGLASGSDGKVTMRNGQSLRRVPGSERKEFAKHDELDSRTSSSRLFQAAANDFATSDRATGKSTKPALGPGFDGLNGIEAERLVDAVGGRDVDSISAFEVYSAADLDQKIDKTITEAEFDRRNAERLIDRIAVNLAKGPVVVSVDWRDDLTTGSRATHAVVVRKVTDKFVVIDNPHGSRDTIPREAFGARLFGANIPLEPGDRRPSPK